MKAVGFKQSLATTEENSFIDFETEKPSPSGFQLLVKIKAIAVNPVDYKVRQNAAKDIILAEPKIIGWDAVAVVEEAGELCSLFDKGDEVFYAGDISKSGCNAEYQLVDERIVARKPKTISIEESAALPLTSLTAWELLFDRMLIDVDKDKGKTILIIGAAGGVGSIAIQLAKEVAELKVIATASRPESITWCKEMGADEVVNHHNLVQEVRNLGIKYVDYIVDFANLNHYWDAMVELIKPQGHLGSITGSDHPIALNKLKTKSVSFSWEYMYTRPMFETEDIIRQHKILNQISLLVEEGRIKSTLQTTINGLNAQHLKLAHQQLESGKNIGKTVIKVV